MAGPPATPSSTTPAAAAASTTAASDASQTAQAHPAASTAAAAPATATNTASDAPATSNGGNVAALSAQMQAMQPFGAPQPAAAHMIHPMYATAALAFPNSPAGAAAGAPGTAPFPFPGYAHHPGHHAPQAGYPAQGAETPATNEAKTTLWMGLEPWMDENYVRSLWNGIVSGPGFAELAAPSNAAGTASAGGVADANVSDCRRQRHRARQQWRQSRQGHGQDDSRQVLGVARQLLLLLIFGTHELARQVCHARRDSAAQLARRRTSGSTGRRAVASSTPRRPSTSIFVGDLAPGT
ncbi:hypothetical protein AMAG_18381 [Allomyces macrogynus ATCC 38327]|uniref:Uncharacterized protein n=1 Tax=Allomyces macrogynus (strain ATCC 38327) TaxID=578462 RepID=A0A0L0S767_ALLM3|nr:hypothetical protein AMAG_18381 [Allomyces macrogynus ATCC 38327]|eukprot:KNE58169.1 hypothetical protein AMAG_18381 [Allomyces macrogynus ATCC 38327]